MNLCCISFHFLMACVASPVNEVSYSDLVDQATRMKQEKVELRVDLGNQLRNLLVRRMGILKDRIDQNPPSRVAWDARPWLDKVAVELGKSIPDYEYLNAIGKQFYGSRKCLNKPEYLAFRNSLRGYVYWLRSSKVRDPQAYQKIYESHLQSIIDELNRHPQNPDLAEMAAAYNWLDHSGQAQDLVRAFQEKFSYAAGIIDVNPNLGKQTVDQFEEFVDQTQFTTNLIAGAQVAGDSQLTGKVRAKILDNPDYATVRIFLQDGIIRTANSLGRKEISLIKGTVLVNGSAVTEVKEAYVDVYFDGKKVVCGEPHVVCSTDSSINRVAFDRKYVFPSIKKVRRKLGMGPDLIEKVVKNQASKASKKKKSQAEMESADIAARNLAESLKEEISAKLTEVASKIESEIESVIEPNFKRHGIYFDRIMTSSSPGRVRIGFEKRGIGQLGAPEPLVSHNAKMDSSLTVMIHESSFMNFFSELSSGGSWTDSTWAYLQKTVSGTNSFAFMIGTRKRWGCKMDWDAPISVRMEDGLIEFHFRMDSFNIEGVEYPHPFKVSAAYRPVVEHYGIDLVREGEMKVQWKNDAPKDPAYRQFVRESFEGLLQPRQHWDSLSIPYGGAWGDMDKLRFEAFETRNGWFIGKASPNKREDTDFFVKGD